MMSFKKLTKRFFVLNFALFAVLWAVLSFAQSLDNKLKQNAILEQAQAPELAEQEQSPNRRVREYPLKAPSIPHSIEGYRINRNFNQCLVCHAQNIAPAMKATAIAVSHFLNRNNEYLAEVSPRRYFCNQCHVPQTVAMPKVTNNR